MHALSVWSDACGAPRADTQFATWAAVDCLARHAEMRVREEGEALIQSVGNERGSRDCRMKRRTLWGPSGKKGLSVILWARHIMRGKSHGYANEEETHGGVSGSGPRAAA